MLARVLRKLKRPLKISHTVLKIKDSWRKTARNLRRKGITLAMRVQMPCHVRLGLRQGTFQLSIPVKTREGPPEVSGIKPGASGGEFKNV